MNPAERLAMLERAKRNPNEVLNLCPCRCQVRHLDDKGYCKHLIGWTIDGQTIELRELFGTGFERTGNILGIVEDDDILVSGTPFRTDKQGNPSPTPTQRVYRRTGKAPVRDDGTYIRRTPGRDMSMEPDAEDAEIAAV